MASSMDPDETPHSVVSQLGLHCLLRLNCTNTYGVYDILLTRIITLVLSEDDVI